MKFCPECGAKVEGMKFCPECGFKIPVAGVAPEATQVINQDNDEKTLLEFSTFMFGAEGKSKKLFGNVDLSIPQMKYTLTTERLLIQKVGAISSQKDEIELFRIKDVAFKQTMKDKLIGVGDITIYSVDPSTPELLMKFIKNPETIKEEIRRAVINAKKNNKVSYREEF